MRKALGKNRAGSTQHHFLLKNGAGFTAVEMVVSLAIIVLLSAQIIVSFSGAGQSAALNRAIQELTGEIRKAQYAAIAVIYAPNSGLPPSPAVGVLLSVGSAPQLIRFIDRNDQPPSFAANGRYDAGQSEKIREYTLPDNVKINRLTDDAGNGAYAAMHILFQVPEATVMLTKDDGAAFPGSRVDIELSSPTGTKKIVTVSITGEINAK